MQLTINEVGMTPVILILAIPSLRIHSNINPINVLPFVVSFVNDFMKSFPFPPCGRFARGCFVFGEF